MAKALVKKGLTRVTRLEFDLLSHEEGWWEGKLDEVRESGMVGLEGGRWTNAGAIGWIRGNDERSAEYDLALQDFAHKVALECLPIADTEFSVGPDGEILRDNLGVPVRTDTQRDRLKTDVRLKLAGKWDRQRYGEHVKVEKTTTVVDDGLLLAGMVELLKLAGKPDERVIEGEVVNDV